MEKEQDIEVLIRRYLLGDISDEERQQVEQQMMTDGEYFRQVSVLEEELVDEYVREQLSAEEQRKFEYYFLSNSQGIEQVKLAKGLRAYALKTRPPESMQSSADRTEPAVRRYSLLDYLRSRVSISGYALAATIILLLLAGSWMIVNLRHLQNQVTQLREQSPDPTAREQELQQQLAEQQARNTKLEEDLKLEQDQRTKIEQELIALKGSQNNNQARSALATILLAPGRVRGAASSNTLILHQAVERVQFQLLLRDAEYDSFKVSLKKDDGQGIWTSGSLKAQSLGKRKAIQVSLPASLLSDGDFYLELQATPGDGNYEAVGNYYFRVSKK